MKYKITYWSAGDATVDRIVEADNQEELRAAIDKLADDPQAPLAQVKHIEFLG